MLTGQSDLAGAVDALRLCEEGYLRLALEQDAGAWVARRFLFEASPAAPSASLRCWDYGDVAFLAGPCTGALLTGWLASPGNFLDHTFSLPRVHDQVSVQEHASLSRQGIAPLRWPFIQYELRAEPTAGRTLTEFRHQEFLVARNHAPSYRSVRFAINDFFFGIHNDTGYALELLVRIARTDAWIEHVHLTPSAMTVSLAGDAIIGCRLELLAPGGEYQSTTVQETSTVELPLPRGLVQHSQLLLSRDGSWRDDRYLDPAYRLDRPDFSWESGDRTSDVEALIAGGETVSVEFKSEVPAGDAARRSAMKTVAAFANADGGILLFGVEDDGAVVGVPDAAKASDTLGNVVRSWLAPVPAYQLDVVELGARSLVVLTVDRGGEDPCGIRVNDEPRYFVRRGATTFAAEPHEVRAVVLARQPAQTTGRHGLGRW